jgi:hypothetical protein
MNVEHWLAFLWFSSAYPVESKVALWTGLNAALPVSGTDTLYHELDPDFIWIPRFARFFEQKRLLSVYNGEKEYPQLLRVKLLEAAITAVDGNPLLPNSPRARYVLRKQHRFAVF